MGPKTEKKRSIQVEPAVTLADPVNTDEWKCAVVLVVEGGPTDAALTRRFADVASMKARRHVKSIDFNSDVKTIINDFLTGEISHSLSFLLNFSSVFEEAGEYMKNNEDIPVALIVKIIKALVLLLKRDDESERKERLLCRDNPIEVMAAKPLMPSYGNEDTEAGVRKPPKNGSVRIKPPTPAKVDTKLLRRGEKVIEHNIIDDIPENSFFRLYIALTGFHAPELALELLKNDIPLHGVICLHCSSAITPVLSSMTDLDAFWNDFLRLLWSPDLTHHFKDIVFQVYTPVDLPTDEKELRSFIYREISFLMYELSDLKHQLRNYHRHMRLWSVVACEEIQSGLSELNHLPQDCVNIPVIMQNMLDTLCGEDDEENDMPESYERVGTLASSTLSQSTTPLAVTPESRSSFNSLVPLTSTVKLPTPRWSTIIDTDEKLLLYNKMLALDRLYDLEDDPDGSLETNSQGTNVCSVRKRRLPCENLDVEIESDRLLMKLWRNYPIREKGDPTVLHDLTARLNYPELTINYVLYVVWIMRMEETKSVASDEKLLSIADSTSETRFTVTDGSRIALQKMNRPQNFFRPSHLKIIPPDMLTSLSAPQLRPAPRFSWTEKSFVSDVHIPVKYLSGAPMTVFDDLRDYLGEEAFSRMTDYDFIEELNKENMIRRIQETASNYDNIRHAYSPLTDCIYIVMSDNPTVNGVQREVYNVMLTTPVGLRDFHNYILDEEREWFAEQELAAGDGATWGKCPDSMYNPKPDFRGFTEYDFWHENSIKYATYEGEVVESVMQRLESIRKSANEEKRASVKSMYAEEGEPYRFVGFDFDPGVVQYSGVDTTFKGPDNCTVRASLQERLYGTQQLGVHVQQGGHNLHLYSYVCPQPHLDNPYTCHVEYKNGTILAFERRVEDETFAYDMKLSFPHGLTVTTVREHVHPCYIKQSYRNVSNEKSRLFLPNGSVIKMLTDNTVQVLKFDTSIVTASLDDLAFERDSEFCDDDAGESSLVELSFREYMTISPNGCEYRIVDDEVVEMRRWQVMTKTEKETGRTFHRRMDGTCYVNFDNGSTCVEYTDGTKICTYLREEEQYADEEPAWDGEDSVGSVYTVVHMKIVMEHPDYATAIYDTRHKTWKMNLPRGSELEVDSRGCYQVHIDGQTELDINTNAIRMWRYSPRDEFIISTIADLTIFGKEPSTAYCTTIDSRGRRFTIEASGTCYVTENDVWNSYGSSTTVENQPEDAEPKRYFVARRDLTGFEIVHKRRVEREMTEPDVVVHSQKLTSGTRYFAILTEPETNKWTVESITPRTKLTAEESTTRSTYGVPPSWMHPFPKRKPKPPTPGVLHGRVILETKPTDCPDPDIRNIFCVTPDPGVLSLSDDVTHIIQRVADQDQVILREIYNAVIRSRTEVNKVPRSGNPEVQKYLKMSQHHVQRREYLKQCIRYRKVPGYFDYPPGIAWQIIHTIIDSIMKEQQPEVAPIPEDSLSSKESTEVEYDLEWSTEPSSSDLSYRSNVSARTAPELSRPPVCRHLLPVPRDAKSEPIYKMEDFPKERDDLSRCSRFTTPSSRICVFTKEDVRELEKDDSSEEPELGVYELEDLMKLGLV